VSSGIDELSPNDFGDRSPFPSSGIVAKVDDPERRHRVQCVIPLIDPEVIYPVWARRMNLFAGPPGYGDFFPPEVGTEVVLFGRFNDPENLYYAALFNEDFPIPPDFPNEATKGMRIFGDFKLIVEGNLMLRGGKVIIESDSTVKISGPAGVHQGTGGES
jgi:hypothetical protein